MIKEEIMIVKKRRFEKELQHSDMENQQTEPKLSTRFETEENFLV
jgi:hypothetical protein